MVSLQEAAIAVKDDGRENHDTKKDDESTRQLIDPRLYLGMLLLKSGQAKESLRLLTEANRIDSSCPVVTAQLGSAMIAAGADTGFAVRTAEAGTRPQGSGQVGR